MLKKRAKAGVFIGIGVGAIGSIFSFIFLLFNHMELLDSAIFSTLAFAVLFIVVFVKALFDKDLD
ncbi:MAG: hypothetical protein HFJ20_04310 [Clostridia bacterium]|nr:hypothetical protein [Clostridia bacterium]MCI8832879.1 hypothetical protein [Clostridia bacterium]